MAVSLSGYSSSREARAGPPHASVYIQVGTGTRHGRRALGPAQPGLLARHGGAKGTGTATGPRAGHRRAQRPEQSPFVQVSPHPLLSLGRRPKPSRNRTQPGSAFESAQEGSAELPKADEHSPSTPLNQSRPSVLGVQGLARLRADPLGTRPGPLIARHRPCLSFSSLWRVLAGCPEHAGSR